MGEFQVAAPCRVFCLQVLKLTKGGRFIKLYLVTFHRTVTIFFVLTFGDAFDIRLRRSFAALMLLYFPTDEIKCHKISVLEMSLLSDLHKLKIQNHRYNWSITHEQINIPLWN